MERELWDELYRILVSLDKFFWRGWYRNFEILAVFFWAVVHDRPVVWACQRRNWDRPPRRLPSQSTMSRRLRSAGVQQLLKALEDHLGGSVLQWVQRIDSKPLPVGSHSKDRHAKLGRAGRGFARGYKLHAIWGSGPLPAAWSIVPMNTGDAPAARELIAKLPKGSGYLVGDKQYDSNPLHAEAAAAGFQVVAPQKRAGQKLGHRPHHPARLRALELVRCPFGQALLRYRDEIERIFGTLTCTAAGLGPLPAWVRRPHRVHQWVQAKLILYATHSRLRTRKRMPAIA